MALDEQQVREIKPDALGPADVVSKCIAVAQGKANMPVSRMFVAGMLAGAFIAFGGMFFCTFISDSQLSFGIQRLIGGLCFCLGLTLVLCCGAELFTGNTLMVIGAAEKKVAIGKMIRNWVVVWLGNFVGALIIVALVYFSHLADMNGGLVGATMISTAVGKVTPAWGTLLAKGILCNTLVCLAVWIGFSARTVVDKIIGLVFPITAFVACGFEHCVANMFFLPMGLVLKLTGFTASVDASALDIGAIFYNLSAATVGNIIGGAVLVGLAYWFAYRKR